jgi:hypothetical protein
MARRCEVCENLTPTPQPAAGRLQRFLLEGRVVALCADHAQTFRNQRPDTLSAAAELFPEPGGQRSLLSRRAPLDRRQFPMRPEGRRRAAGRRTGDAGDAG